MSAAARLAALSLFTYAALAPAMNRCVLPSGRILYTDESCESVGGRADRPVKNELSVVPLPTEAPPAREAAASADKAGPRRTSLGFPILSVCYDPADARPEVGHGELEDVIRGSLRAWNLGCRVSFEYVGFCLARRRADVRVVWKKYGDITFEGKALRDHAIAAANPAAGIVGINREIDERSLVRGWRSAVVHEFGHITGIGHSSDPDDVMYPSGFRETPTANDFAACNRGIEARYGRPR